MRVVYRWLILSVCMTLICSIAMGEVITEFNGPGYDQLSYACTLPDGRMIFSGSRGEVGNYQESKARLLCLNPDKTVSWEYWDPAEGHASFGVVRCLENGTLAVFYTNSPYQRLKDRKIRYFTTEGVPLEKTVDLYRADSMLRVVGPFCLEMTVIPGDAVVYYHYFLDWEGNELFRISSKEMISAFSSFESEDGVVILGQEPTWPANAKIMKVDLKGNIIWETVMPTQLEVTPSATLEWCRQTSDGGYIALYRETGNVSTDGVPQRWEALVRFSQDGRLLWMNHDSFPQEENPHCHGLTEYNGTYVMELSTCSDYDDIQNPRIFCWFDADGHELGRTKLLIRKEDLDVPAGADKIENYGGSFVIMPDGLWSLRDIWVEGHNHLQEMDSRDEVLFKVPEYRH